MKVFCDTNILIAAFFQHHPHHHAARPVLERVQSEKDHGFVAAHSLAETYAVLTRLPGLDQVPPAIVWQLISENVLKVFSVVALTAKEYADTLNEASASGVEGGKTYDALLLAAATKSGAERIYTMNVAHFRNLAPVSLQSRIMAP